MPVAAKQRDFATGSVQQKCRNKRLDLNGANPLLGIGIQRFRQARNKAVQQQDP
jgi:hypothetical protein